MNLQNNFTRTNRNLRQVLEKWDKKCTSGGCFCCTPEWEKQEQQRIHMCYSLYQNHMYKVKVTDKHTAESLRIFHLKKWPCNGRCRIWDST